MFEFIGFGIFSWLCKELIEDGIDTHFDVKTSILEYEFQHHLDRLLCKKEDELFQQYLLIFRIWGRYKELISFRKRFLLEFSELMHLAFQEDERMITLLETVIGNPASGKVFAKPRFYPMIEIISFIGYSIENNSNKELFLEFVRSLAREKGTRVRDIYYEQMGKFLMMERIWNSFQKVLFQHSSKGAFLEQEYLRILLALKPVTESSLRKIS